MTTLVETPRRPRSSGRFLPSLPLAGAAAAALLSAAFVAAVRLHGRYQADLARARQRLAAAGGRVAQTACGPIEYATAGAGIPVLEVHGIFGGFDQGLLVARPVLGDGFGIVAPSRFGYLGTPLPADASPARQADAHTCLLDHLGIERAVVMAHSAGSISAIQLALQYPVRVARPHAQVSEMQAAEESLCTNFPSGFFQNLSPEGSLKGFASFAPSAGDDMHFLRDSYHQHRPLARHETSHGRYARFWR
jgi:pimeloyl-ACP methyl ester carboxylesterase